MNYQLIGYALSTDNQERPALWGIYAPIVDTDTGELCADPHQLTRDVLFVFSDGQWVNVARYNPVPLKSVLFSLSPDWEADSYLTYYDVLKANELRKAQKGDSA